LVGRLAVKGMSSEDGAGLELANSVVERLSAHVESLRLFEEAKQGQVELEKRAQQLAAVAEVSTVSSRELNIDHMLASVVQLAQRKFDLYHAHIFLYEEATQELRITACGWPEGSEHAGTRETALIPLAQEQSLVARAGRSRQAVIINDVRNEPGWLPNPLLPDTVSEIAVPLVVGDQLLGVLDVQSNRVNAFSDEDANIFATLATQVATALQNARSFTQAQQQAERETMLNLIGQKIRSATSVDAVLQIAARELGHALGAPLTIAQLGLKDKK
jgi:GAF domain-containing protein